MNTLSIVALVWAVGVVVSLLATIYRFAKNIGYVKALWKKCTATRWRIITVVNITLLMVLWPLVYIILAGICGYLFVTDRETFKEEVKGYKMDRKEFKKELEEFKLTH